MNVKTNDFVVFTQQLVFSWAEVGITEVTITQLPRRLTAKKNFQNEWQETETQTKKKKLTKAKCR